MLRTMMKSKLHRGTVTAANLHYVGSITVDEDLMDAADLLPNEKVQVVDIDNGARLETYVIPGERGSGDLCLNGAAARLVQPGDKIIVISYGVYTDAEAREHTPTVLVLDETNRAATVADEPPHTTVAELLAG
jgi:aspartate 1-decarboxylase